MHGLLLVAVGVAPFPELRAAGLHQYIEPVAVGQFVGLLARLGGADLGVVQHHILQDNAPDAGTTFFQHWVHVLRPRPGWRHAHGCGQAEPLKLGFQGKIVNPGGLLRTPAEGSLAERVSLELWDPIGVVDRQ